MSNRHLSNRGRTEDDHQGHGHPVAFEIEVSSVHVMNLQRSTIFATLATAGIALGLVMWRIGRPSDQAQFATRDLLKNAGVQFDIATGAFDDSTYWGWIRGIAPTAADVNHYCQKVLSIELQRYPRQFFRAINLKRVVLAANLSFAGQPRALIPDFEHETLYIDVVAGNTHAEYPRRALHHELYHMIDQADGARLYDDPEWASLNSSGFQYPRGGGKDAQTDPTGSILRDDLPGFVSSYAKSAAEEDKAELFSAAMTNPQFLAERIRSDVIVRTKYRLLRKRISAFCSDLDTGAWPPE
jgi:hypothetical protein